jgi:uncharacterized protein
MPESSMEEIIASISRIIAEDNRVPHPTRTGLGSTNGILELTEAIEADGSVRKLAGAASSDAEPAGEPMPAPVARRIEPQVPNVDSDIGDKPDQPSENILSSGASEAAVAAFGRLAAVPRERRAEPELSVGTGSRTLEEIVRDALRPLLRAWLDDHLPGIVERLVRDEIERVARETGRR